MLIASVLREFTDVTETDLICWINRGWVRPDDEPAGWRFQDIDLARIRLIRDLSRDMEVADDTIPLILSLLDQVYGLRDSMDALRRAVAAQPDHVRRAILGSIA